MVRDAETHADEDRRRKEEGSVQQRLMQWRIRLKSS